MSNLGHPWKQSRGSSEDPPDDFGHPRGTLAVVVIFGLLFLLGWLAMYLYLFLERGATHP